MLVQSNVIKTRYKIIAINTHTHTHTHRGRCDGQEQQAVPWRQQQQRAVGLGPEQEPAPPADLEEGQTRAWGLDDPRLFLRRWKLLRDGQVADGRVADEQRGWPLEESSQRPLHKQWLQYVGKEKRSKQTDIKTILGCIACHSDMP